MLVLMTIIWGATFLFTRTGTVDTSPFLFLSIRLLGSGLIFLPIIIKALKKSSRGLIRSLARGLLLGALMFLGYGSQTISLQFTTIAKCSFFTYTFAVFVPPLQYLFTGKPVTRRNLIGLALVFTGVYLFANPENLHMNKGDLIALAGAMGYALYILLIDRFGKEEDAAVSTGLQLLTCGAVSLIACMIFEQPFIRFSPAFIIAELYLILPGTVLALFVMNKYQKSITPVKAVIIYALEPLVSALLGWLVLAETLSWVEMCGCLFILGGVLFSELIKAKSRIGAPLTG